MRIQRIRPARRSAFPVAAWGCLLIAVGMMAVCILTILLILPALPGIALTLAGFEPKGETVNTFTSAIIPPTVEIHNAVRPPQLIVNAGTLGSHTLNANTGSYSVTVGASATGHPVMRADFTEEGLRQICLQLSQICAARGGVVQNGRFDLRAGGLILYADVLIPQLGIWQYAGIVLKLNNFNRLEAVGVDIKGQLYTIPPDNLGQQVAEAERTANNILSQLTVQAAGIVYTLSEIVITDDAMSIILR